MANKPNMTPAAKRQALFQKNLKKLGFILLDCALLTVTSLQNDLNLRNRDFLKTRVDKMMERYEYRADTGFNTDQSLRLKKEVLELISNLVLLEEKDLVLAKIFEIYFQTEQMTERYTHQAFMVK